MKVTHASGRLTRNPVRAQTEIPRAYATIACTTLGQHATPVTEYVDLVEDGSKATALLSRRKGDAIAVIGNEWLKPYHTRSGKDDKTNELYVLEIDYLDTPRDERTHVRH